MLSFRPAEIIVPKHLLAKPAQLNFHTSMHAATVLHPLHDFIKSFKDDIYAYCDILKFNPNWQQRELLDAYQAGECRIACRAGKGPGKTAATGVTFSHWSLTHKDSKLIVTAPTFRQCKDVWLAQVKKLIYADGVDKRLKDFFSFRGTGYGIAGMKDNEWGCQLVTALKKEAFQGAHEKYLAFLEEEASGVPQEISEAITETLKNPDGMFLHVRIGNPNCVLGHCEVYDPSRGRITVRELAFEDSCRVTAMDESTEKISKHTASAFLSGTKPCVKLTASTGQQIELSTDHPIYTPKGWMLAGEAKENDFIAMPRYLPSPDNYSKMRDEEIRLIAYFLSDGNTTHGANGTARSSFANADFPIQKEFVEDIFAMGGYVKMGEMSGKATTLNCSGMQEYLRKWGISRCSAKTKRVPQEIFLLPDKQLGLFLNRLWSCDGSFNRYGPKICLCNKKLLDDIQTLLLRLGIHSTIWYTQVNVKEHHKTFDYLKGRKFDAWTLAVTERESQIRWQEVVGPVLTKENNMKFASGTNPNSDVVPVDNSRLNEIFAEMGLPYTGKKKGTLTAILRKKYKRVRNLSRQAYQQFCIDARYNGKYAKWASNDIRWVRIKSVENIGIHEVYDLTVPEAGNFVCNNLIIHNTRTCVFFDSFNKEASKWLKLHWNTEETPETPYFSKKRNEEIAEEFGKNSDVYKISVLGEFPNLDPNCLISDEDLDACCTPETMHRAMHENPDRTKQIGLDLARYGGDECVAVWRRGGVLYQMWADKTDPNNAVDKAVAGQMLYGWENNDCIYCVDTSGMGETAVGNIGDSRRMGRRVHEFYSQNSAIENDKYHDKITEAWCNFAKLVKQRLIYLGEKIDKKLKQQLTSRRYVVTPKGKIKIESKDEYAKNNSDSENGTIGKSPDRADGVVMAFYPHATDSTRIAAGD